MEERIIVRVKVMGWDGISKVEVVFFSEAEHFSGLINKVGKKLD